MKIAPIRPNYNLYNFNNNDKSIIYSSKPTNYKNDELILTSFKSKGNVLKSGKVMFASLLSLFGISTVANKDKTQEKMIHNYNKLATFETSSVPKEEEFLNEISKSFQKLNFNKSVGLKNGQKYAKNKENIENMVNSGELSNEDLAIYNKISELITQAKDVNKIKDAEFDIGYRDSKFLFCGACYDKNGKQVANYVFHPYKNKISNFVIDTPDVKGSYSLDMDEGKIKSLKLATNNNIFVDFDEQSNSLNLHHYPKNQKMYYPNIESILTLDELIKNEYFSNGYIPSRINNNF